jgi:hypothetical protein
VKIYSLKEFIFDSYFHKPLSTLSNAPERIDERKEVSYDIKETPAAIKVDSPKQRRTWAIGSKALELMCDTAFVKAVPAPSLDKTDSTKSETEKSNNTEKSEPKLPVTILDSVDDLLQLTEIEHKKSPQSKQEVIDLIKRTKDERTTYDFIDSFNQWCKPKRERLYLDNIQGVDWVTLELQQPSGWFFKGETLRYKAEAKAVSFAYRQIGVKKDRKQLEFCNASTQIAMTKDSTVNAVDTVDCIIIARFMRAQEFARMSIAWKSSPTIAAGF